MEAGLFAFFSTFLACAILVGTKRLFRAGLDEAGSGPQKVHGTSVPRVGGIPVFAGILLGALWLGSTGDRGNLIYLLALAAVPALSGGLYEDISKRFPPRARLATASASPAPSSAVSTGGRVAGAGSRPSAR